MAEPTFTRVGDTALYWADPVAAFLASAPGALGEQPTLTRTWQDSGGAYVLLGAPAADSPGFLRGLQDWIRRYAPQGPPRFLWVADPAAPPFIWETTAMTAQLRDGHWTASGATFQLEDYRLALAGAER